MPPLLTAGVLRARRIGLIPRFVLISLTVGILVGGASATFVEARLVDIMRAQVALRATDQAQLGVAPYVTAADFDPPYPPAKLDDLSARLTPLLARARQDGAGVLRFHVFDPQGTIVYSDLPGKRGANQLSPQSPNFAAALAGGIGTNLSSLSAPENAELRQRYGRALEVYVPVVLDGQVVGVYEIYQDLGPLAVVRPLVWFTVAAGATILFLSLFGLIHGAEVRLQRQQLERERLVRAAAEADKLRDMDRWRSELLSTVSHELRTPLALVHGFAELLTLETRTFPPEQMREMAREIHRGSSTMARMVEDLLDFSRVEQGRLRLRLAESDLTEVVRQAVGSFITSQSGGERLRLELPSTPLLAHVDADRVSQIVANLVSNALRYAPEGPIVVRLQEDPPGQALLEVQDRGPGMTPEVLARVWEMFYRAPEATSSPVRGAGIGLALVKNLAEAHGGHVEAISAPGQGTAFRIHLPLPQDATPRGKATRARSTAPALASSSAR